MPKQIWSDAYGSTTLFKGGWEWKINQEQQKDPKALQKAIQQVKREAITTNRGSPQPTSIMSGGNAI
jgi:hypothetical protein